MRKVIEMTVDDTYVRIKHESDMDKHIQLLHDSYTGFWKKRKFLKELNKIPHKQAGKTYQLNFYLEPNVNRQPDTMVCTSIRHLYLDCGIHVIVNLFQPIWRCKYE